MFEINKVDPFNPRKYWRGRLAIESFAISAPAEQYKRFWHDVDAPRDIVLTFHYSNLPKRVNRGRRQARLGGFVKMVLENDFFALNTLGDPNADVEAVIRMMLYEWLNLHAKKEFGNLRRHLVAISVEQA